MKFVFTVLFAAIFFVSYSQIQIISIEGVVKDFEGTPVTGATVRVQHSNGGTWTSAIGAFRLDGVKFGDTLVFSNVAFHKAYFVVQKKYNILNFRLLRDTMHIFLKEGTSRTYFSFGNTSLNYNSAGSRIEFYETALPAKMVAPINNNYIFTKVEVNPSVYCSYPKLVDTLTNDVNQLNKKFKPVNNGGIKVYFWVKENKTIEVSTVEGEVKNEVKNIFIRRLESVKSVDPAIQNGRFADVLCVAEFIFIVGKDKNITLKMANY